MPDQNKYRYVVVGKKQENDKAATLELALLGGSTPPYKAGQYITVYFPNSNTPSGKAYSISSAPSENRFALTVEAVGEYSSRLSSLVPGDTFLASLPRGSFYPEPGEDGLVFLAGGIGITPFRSMIVEMHCMQAERQMYLFYSVRMQENFLFEDAFKPIEARERLYIQRHITGKSVAGGTAACRIRITDILYTVRDIKKAEFLICGSIPFVREFRKDLIDSRIDEGRIYTEALF
jgi:ferredoxin-NADP reductase